MASTLDQALINRLKAVVITSLVSDDQLMETLILKGGNAISMGYGLEDRASYDLDYSIEEDFPDRDEVAARIEGLLKEGFAAQGYTCFDYKFLDKPKTQIQNQDFWGGYYIEFKLIDEKTFKSINYNLNEARSKYAIPLGKGGSPKLSIDISKFEYVGEHKQQKELDGFQYYLYAPELIIAEKVRAICQKIPEYTTDVLQQKLPNHEKARARDFYDIHLLSNYAEFHPNTEDFKNTLRQVFDAKRVPVEYLHRIRDMREVHRLEFDSLKDTLRDEEVSRLGFDFYFDYVLDLFEHLLD